MEPTPDMDVVDEDQVAGWAQALSEVEAQLRPYFRRTAIQQHALAYIRGLLSGAARKNSWQLAEMTGASTPYAFQHLLGRAGWDEDGARDQLQDYVAEHLGHPEAVLVLDETGFLKKGRMSAGVGRQYSGTAGRVENCQIGVFAAYVSVHGHTLVDRELYLPKDWCEDAPRRQQAGIPAERAFATKPQLARQMIERTTTRLPVAWVVADSAYGDDVRLRRWLEEREQPYLLAVSGKSYLWMGWGQQRISTLLAELPPDGWQQLSAGHGAKGPRLYDWWCQPFGGALQEPNQRWLLVRRSLAEPDQLRAYVVFAPQGTTLEAMVAVAGQRWAIETAFEMAKGEVGLDHYEVRSWTGWYRHVTLALWAQAFLVVVGAQAHAAAWKKKTIGPATPSSLAQFKAQRGLSSG